MEQRFADLTRKIREAVIKKAQEQASEREEASNGCVRILLVAHCEEASSWMFLPSGRDRYEETTPIVPGSDMILQEDESLEIDHSVVAAMKIAHCMKARRLKKGSISFSKEIWFGEGMLFNIDCLQYVDDVAIGNKMVYHQTFNPGSAMRSFNLASNYCGIASLWLQRSHWKKSNPQIEMEWRYHTYRFNRNIIDGLVRSGQVSQHKRLYKECVRNIRKDILLPLKLEKSFKKRVGWVLYYISPAFMTKRSARKFELLARQHRGKELIENS